jgi:hypothetical protein
MWPIFVLAGVEQVSIVPGGTTFAPLVFNSYGWPHAPHIGESGGRWFESTRPSAVSRTCAGICAKA